MLNYIKADYKTKDGALVFGKDFFPEKAFEQMAITKKTFPKDIGRQYAHFVGVLKKCNYIAQAALCKSKKTVFECKTIKFPPPNGEFWGIWAHRSQGLLTQVPAAFENYKQPLREALRLDFWQCLCNMCADFPWKNSFIGASQLCNSSI